MFLRKKSIAGQNYWSLVESYRENGKVRQKVILNLGNTNKAYETLKGKLELTPFLSKITPYIAEQVPRILHYPGSKWSMTEWIINYMPQHNTYLEPFFGSGAVFFRKNKSKNETINDIDGNVVNLFKVIRESPEKLAHVVQWTPYSRDEYYYSLEYEAVDPIEKARLFLVRMWQAIGGKTSDELVGEVLLTIKMLTR